MCAFKQNQKVVCIADGWERLSTKSRYKGPKKNEIVTIKQFEERYSKTYLILKEYEFDENGKSVCFEPEFFRPLQYDKNASKEVLKRFAPTEEKADLEIKIKEYNHQVTENF